MNEKAMRRIFLDSSVLIAACASSNGASYAVIVMAEIGLFQVVISPQIIQECERNLNKKLPTFVPIFKRILATIKPEILPNPTAINVSKWEAIIEIKDAPILAVAVEAKVDRLLTLNTKDFTHKVANQTGLVIQTPSQFIQEVRTIITREI